MADDHGKKKKSKLGKAFKKAAKFALWGAFSFAVLGGLDFVLFHGMPEGQAFIEAIRPAAEGFLRAEDPFFGMSVANAFQGSAEFISQYTGGSISSGAQYANAATAYTGAGTGSVFQPDFLNQFN